mmetsp:Transcript_33011/g.60510  ORF Transcript_33011/g.60510 Transcript_33011/m.60510 type:complete len:146 (+) Transcript_33011:63-500(+)
MSGGTSNVFEPHKSVEVPTPLQFHRPRPGLGTFIPPALDTVAGSKGGHAFQSYGEYWQAGQSPEARGLAPIKPVTASSSYWPFGRQVTEVGFENRIEPKPRSTHLASLADIHPPRSPALRMAGSQTMLLGSFEEHTRKYKRYPVS